MDEIELIKQLEVTVPPIVAKCENRRMSDEELRKEVEPIKNILNRINVERLFGVNGTVEKGSGVGIGNG